MMTVARKMLINVGLLCLSLLLAAGMVRADTAEVMLGGKVFELEVVADPASRTQGLMGRTELGDNQGMLFDFPMGTQPAIWMRNMVISLDLLYVDAEGRLVQLFDKVPPCAAMPCDVYRADRPLRFVIEVPAGTAERAGLQIGDNLDLNGLLATPPPDL
ncbi:MAG TPA: DUF192 domain-containing protein [Pseudomonas xinjiangensis]|uniref:DUF192 domain-containing protein n=2 Tax=root TaxID=1 RepID=A0A7V1BS18_9GAMM|nr:DUF192 domain-containing protein [Halopseudomonas xinjiangensis]HEC46960.1 DUF192 domain-containing protein [Halopseudomonas xinjiangensis]